MRRRGKRDANHGEIKAALQKVGASVLDLADLGDDAPDMLVGFRHLDQLVEVKSGKNGLEPGQEKFISEWRGRPVRVVRSVDEALAAFGALVTNPYLSRR